MRSAAKALENFVKRVHINLAGTGRITFYRGMLLRWGFYMRFGFHEFELARIALSLLHIFIAADQESIRRLHMLL